jgi:hypothetical protein
VRGPAGSLLLAHYLLAHNIGGNTGGGTRRCLYFRLTGNTHLANWTGYVTDPLAEFEPPRRHSAGRATTSS